MGSLSYAMIKLSYLFDKIKDVKFMDYISVLPMTLALVIMPLYRKKYSGAWLICEEPSEARDNGYYFYKYMYENHPQKKCFYAIKRSSVDYNRIKKLGGTVEYGSLRHWLVFFLCEYNISSQKGGKPNAAMCAFMEINGRFKTKNVFLQHGVIINNVRSLYADRSKIYKFITSTSDETEYIEKNFGYPKGTVVCTGMPRFDGLHNVSVNENQIVVMPTWRYWFNLKSKQNSETGNRFKDSEYFIKWNELLNSPQLKKLCDEGLTVVFYLHRNIQRYSNLFKASHRSITIASWEDYDIQSLLKESELMITDYSSVFFDMVYMRKPILFYQFDEDKFRKYQCEKGYFDYHNNPFGKCFSTHREILVELAELKKKDFCITADYETEHKRLFTDYDDRNSERIFMMLESDLAENK